MNADDVDACISAVHLAVEFRRSFGRDVLIDVIGYRRFGHNEQDEPAYTQPLMYEKIKSHPTARELFANKLIAQGIDHGRSRRAEMIADATTRLQEAYRNVKEQHGNGTIEKIALAARFRRRRRLRRSIARSCSSGRTSSSPFPTASRSTRNCRRSSTVAKRVIAEKGLVDWGMAEALAFASLLRVRRADPHHRSRYRARNVQPPSCGAARSGNQHANTCRCSICRMQRPASKSTTARSRSTRASASNTAMPRRFRIRSSCGKRSSATSSTARRSSSINSSPRAKRSGVRPRV